EQVLLHAQSGLPPHDTREGEPRPLVASNAGGLPRGYVVPGVWTLSEHSLLHAFLTPRNGIARRLILPAPHEDDSHAVVEALLQALNTYWRSQETGADLIRWPSHESWLSPILQAHGF